MGIGRRIKEAREKVGLTQEELGKLVGVTGSAITNYEKETSHPKEPVMYALIDALEVDANFLFQDCVKVKTSSSSIGKDVRLNEIQQIYHKMNEDGRELMLANARSLYGMRKYNTDPRKSETA